MLDGVKGVRRAGCLIAVVFRGLLWEEGGRLRIETSIAFGGWPCTYFDVVFSYHAVPKQPFEPSNPAKALQHLAVQSSTL